MFINLDLIDSVQGRRIHAELLVRHQVVQEVTCLARQSKAQPQPLAGTCTPQSLEQSISDGRPHGTNFCYWGHVFDRRYSADNRGSDYSRGSQISS